MPNTYLTSGLISKEAVALYKTLNTFYATGYKGDYEKMFNGGPYKAGNTIDVRMDNYFIGQRGDTVTAEDIVEDSFPLTIQPLYSIPIRYTPTDLQRSINDFSAEFIQPAVRRLIAMLNTDIAEAAKTQVNYFVGDRTAYTNSFAAINAVNPLLTRLNANGYKRYLALSPENATALQNSALQSGFVAPLNKDITYDARITRLAGIDIMQDSSITQHIPGTHAAGGNITVKTAVGSGSTIVLTGLTAGATFKAGDKFSLGSVKAFDRINRVPLMTDMQFVVTADATANGSGDATLTIFPELIADGPLQNFYVAGADPNVIPVGAIATFIGNGSAQAYLANIAYTERGLIVVTPPLERMDSPESSVMNKDGISIRVSKTAEVLDNKNVMRMDLQAAFKWVPDQAVNLISKP